MKELKYKWFLIKLKFYGLVYTFSDSLKKWAHTKIKDAEFTKW